MTTNKRTKTDAELKAEVLAKISTYKNKDLAIKMHDLISDANPSLSPRLWYGMPGYAKSKDSAVLLFFREDIDLMTFGLSEHASFSVKADADSLLMPCAWFFNSIDKRTEDKIKDIVKEATK